MKKRALCALLVLVLAVSLLPVPAYAEDYVKIDRSNFPDPTFRTFVSLNFDKDRDNYLSSAEIEKVTEIQINDEDITLIRGVEWFTSLTVFNCNSCSIRDMSYLSGNPHLEKLYCDNNEITKLDLSSNPRLKEVSCYNNDIRAIDVSKCSALTYLECSRNELETLDISKNTALTTLLCYTNKLTKLDISKNKKLEYLCCYENSITELDISACPQLVEAYRAGDKTDPSFEDIKQYWVEHGSGYDVKFYDLEVDKNVKIIDLAKPRIKTQPRSASVKAGSKVTFRVKATGDQLKYQWYARKPGTKKWVKVKNAAKATLTFKATAKMNGYKYRCRVYNRTASVYSKTVTLKVKK